MTASPIVVCVLCMSWVFAAANAEADKCIAPAGTAAVQADQTLDCGAGLQGVKMHRRRAAAQSGGAEAQFALAEL